MIEAIRVLEERVKELEDEKELKILEYHLESPKQELGYGVTLSKKASDAYDEANRLSSKSKAYRSAIVDLKKAAGWWIDGVSNREELVTYLEREGWYVSGVGDAGEMWALNDTDRYVAVLYGLKPDTYEWRGVLERVNGKLRNN